MLTDSLLGLVPIFYSNYSQYLYQESLSALLSADYFVMTVIHLLVCQDRVALQWRQVAVGQGSAGSVMLTKDCIIDVMKAIARHQSVSTGGTAETLSMKVKHDTDEI